MTKDPKEGKADDPMPKQDKLVSFSQRLVRENCSFGNLRTFQPRQFCATSSAEPLIGGGL